jgi:hypothetical protein
MEARRLKVQSFPMKSGFKVQRFKVQRFKVRGLVKVNKKATLNL